MIRCFEKLKPLAVVILPPFAAPSIKNILKLLKFFPGSTDINPHALHAEFSYFVAHIELLNNTSDNKKQITEFS